MDRCELLKKEKIDKEIYEYLKELFQNLNIEILGDYEGKLFDLMNNGLLEGWCWETTETAALFMPDDSIVYRANLNINDESPYYHAFISFKYKEDEYIFDPCLNLINTRDNYLNTLEADIKGYVTAKEIKDYFLNYIKNPPKREYSYSEETALIVEKMMRKFFGDSKKDEIYMHSKEDKFFPMYRNESGYKNIEISDNKIKSLIVHYYLNA